LHAFRNHEPDNSFHNQGFSHPQIRGSRDHGLFLPGPPLTNINARLKVGYKPAQPVRPAAFLANGGWIPLAIEVAKKRAFHRVSGPSSVFHLRGHRLFLRVQRQRPAGSRQHCPLRYDAHGGCDGLNQPSVRWACTHCLTRLLQIIHPHKLHFIDFWQNINVKMNHKI